MFEEHVYDRSRTAGNIFTAFVIPDRTATGSNDFKPSLLYAFGFFHVAKCMGSSLCVYLVGVGWGLMLLLHPATLLQRTVCRLKIAHGQWRYGEKMRGAEKGQIVFLAGHAVSHML